MHEDSPIPAPVAMVVFPGIRGGNEGINEFVLFEQDYPPGFCKIMDETLKHEVLRLLYHRPSTFS